MSPELRQLLWFLIASGRGGRSRWRILEALRENPRNAHQLSAALELDYRTVRYHLSLLERHGLVLHPSADRYGSRYLLAPDVVGQFDLVREVGLRTIDRPLARPSWIGAG